MRYSYSGYFTKEKRIEKRIIKLTPIIIETMLAGYLSKVDEVRVIFMKNSILDWTEQFPKLYKNKVITIYIPKFYRSRKNPEGLLIHDVAHIKQILEGRLKIKNGSYYYCKLKEKQKNKYSIVINNNDWYVLKNDKIHINKNRPWETECSKIEKRFREESKL